MNHEAKIIYLDGKELNVILNNPDMKFFLNCIKKDEPFYYQQESGAFYAPKKNIRCVQITAKMEGAKNEAHSSGGNADGAKEKSSTSAQKSSSSKRGN